MTAQPKPVAAEVPTTQRVREDYVLGSAFSESDHPVWGQRFDRWLAEHDAQVAAEARQGVVVRLAEMAASYEHDDRLTPRSGRVRTHRTRPGRTRRPQERRRGAGRGDRPGQPSQGGR